MGALVCLMLVLLKGKGNSLEYFKKWVDRINFNFRKTVSALQGEWFGFAWASEDMRFELVRKLSSLS